MRAEPGPTAGALAAAALIAFAPPALAQPGGFNAFETSTPAAAVSGVIRTKVAGVGFDLALVALNATRSAVDAGFTGSVAVDLLDASDDSGSLDPASGCRSSWPVARSVSPNFAFPAAGGGRAQIALVEPDAWRALRVRVTFTRGGTSLRGCSNDAFAVRPAAIVGLAASAGSDSTPGTLRPLDNTDPVAGIVHRAGRPFAVSGVAVNAAGAATPGYSGAPQLQVTACLQPAGCGAGAIAAALVASAGRLSGAATYDEAGVVAVRAEDLGFAAIDAADSSIDERALRSAPVTIGRFVADRYRLSSVHAPAFAPGLCGAGPAQQGFTFVGQDFSFATAPTVLATPVNAAGAPLVNARPRFGAAHVSAQLAAPSAPAALTGIPAVASVANGAAATIAFAPSSFRFTRDPAMPVASFVPDLEFTARVSDTTEAGATAPIASEAPLTLSGLPFSAGSGRFHYGRVQLRPVHGDGRRPLAVPLEVQSFNGSGWVALADAGACLVAAPEVFAYSAATGALDAGGGAPNCSARVLGSVTTAGGRATVTLARPAGASVAPSAMVLTLNLLTAAAGQTCSGATLAPAQTLALPWLAAPDGAGAHAANPAVRVSWGRARGEFISVRERFD